MPLRQRALHTKGSAPIRADLPLPLLSQGGRSSVAWLNFPSRDFSLVSGEPTRYRSSVDVSRTFCGQCGTTLTYRNDGNPDSVFVTAGSLDDPDEFPPTHHVFIEN